jgi:hypothetical protein
MHEFDSSAFPREAEYEYAPEGSVFSEAQEVQLAEQLLELENEEELEQFLGDLIKKAGGAIGSLIKSPLGQALKGALTGVAGKILPAAGQAIGGIFGSTGAKIGSQIGSAANSAFGMSEMEASEQEFEAAQTFVRMAGDAVRNAAQSPPGANPHAVAHAALAQAAEVHAPGLSNAIATPQTFGTQSNFGGMAAGMLAGAGHGHAFGRGRSGHWERQGNKIILHGA